MDCGYEADVESDDEQDWICDDCEYYHHFEDKCPTGKQCKFYETQSYDYGEDDYGETVNILNF